MGATKPNFKPNVAANLKTATVEKLFVDIPKDATMRVRFLPPVDETGLIFYRTANHFKVFNEDGKPTALACLQEHGNDDTGDSCYLCRLSKHLYKTGDKDEKEIAKGLNQSLQWYAQILVAEKTEDGWLYKGPRLLRMPMSGVEAVNEILSNQQKNEETYFCDSDGGHDLMITHLTKTPWYRADRVNKPVSLNDIFPDWEEKRLKDIYSELRLNIVSPAEQREAAIRAHGKALNFDELAEFGL